MQCQTLQPYFLQQIGTWFLFSWDEQTVLPLCTVRIKGKSCKELLCLLSAFPGHWQLKENRTSHCIQASQTCPFCGDLLIDLAFNSMQYLNFFFYCSKLLFFHLLWPLNFTPLPTPGMIPKCDKCRISSVHGSALMGQEPVVWKSSDENVLTQFPFRLILGWVCRF